MWLWQRRELHKPSFMHQEFFTRPWMTVHHVYLLKIASFITALHVFILFIAFFICKDAAPQLINLQAVSGTVLFLPFQKTVAQKGNARASTTSSSAPNSLKVIRTKSLSSSVQSQVSLPQTKAATSIVDIAPKQSARALRKKKLQEKAKRLQERKRAAEKAKKEKEAKKQEQLKKAKQVEAKQIPVNAAKEIKQPDVAQPIKNEAVGVPAGEQSETIPTDAVYVGQYDLDMLELQEAIHTQVTQCWKSPVGIAPGKVCKVRVSVNWQGKAEEIVIEESSKVLVFDMSVRQALRAMEFPKRAYGKELILPFRS